MCFGGGSQSAPPPQDPPPPKDTPSPAGNDANQRFAQLRAGMYAPKDGTVIDDAPRTKGATVLGETA